MKYLVIFFIIGTLLFMGSCGTDDDSCSPDPEPFQFVLEETNYPDFNNRFCDPDLKAHIFTYDTIISSPNINDLCFVHGNAPLVCYVKRYNLNDSLFVLDRSNGKSHFIMNERSIYNLNAAQNTLVCEANGGEIWVVDLNTGNTQKMSIGGWRPKVSPSGSQLYFQTSRDSGRTKQYYSIITDINGNIQREVRDNYRSLQSWNAKGDGIYTTIKDTISNARNWVLLKPATFNITIIHEYYEAGGGVICQAEEFGKKWLTISDFKVWKADIGSNSETLLFKFCENQNFKKTASYDPLTQRIYFCLERHNVNEDKTIDFIEQRWYSVDEAGTDFKEVKLNL
jgi:hypothetical protein